MKKGSKSTKLVSIAGGLGSQGKSTLILLLAALTGSIPDFNVLVVELEEKGKIIQLRHQDLGSGKFHNQTCPYDIISLSPESFHDLLPDYASNFNLIFVEIPSIEPTRLFVDTLLLSQFIICPIIGNEKNFEANSAYFKMLARVKRIKSTKGLEFEIYAIFNKYKFNENLNSYFNLAKELRIHFFSSVISLNEAFVQELNTYLTPETQNQELKILVSEFIELINQSTLFHLI